MVEHAGGPEPTRLYANLLGSAHADELFEYYFTVELARVGLDGTVQLLGVARGLLSSVDVSPGGSHAVLTRIARPFPRLVPAHRFPSSVEVWDLTRGRRLAASRVEGWGVSRDPDEREQPRRFAWKPGQPTTASWVVHDDPPGGKGIDRWMALALPGSGEPHQIARSEQRIARFGWTTAGTPYFITRSDEDVAARVFTVGSQGPSLIWTGSTTDRYGDPGRALRIDGDDGPVLEADGRIFLAGDGLGSDGPRPFLEPSTCAPAARSGCSRRRPARSSPCSRCSTRRCRSC
jgi:hypothetical protein